MSVLEDFDPDEERDREMERQAERAGEPECSMCKGSGLSADGKRICISCGGEGYGDIW